MSVLRCLRTGMAGLGLALLVPVLAVSPVSAGHVSITVDGDLTDLINEVNANLGADKGGAVTPDPEGTGDIGNGCPYYVNGYDFDTGYIMYDFLDASQDPTADVALYVGFDMVGVIGDVDGNGNPDTETSPTPCNANESPAIGMNLELYRIVIDFDCVGGSDLTLGVTGDAVRNLITLAEIPGAEYAVGSNADLNANDGRDKLEIGIPLASILPSGTNICDVSIRLTSNAVDDFLQEDQGETAYFGIPVAVSVTKDPPEQEVCPGDEVTWTITATNEGICEATEMTVTDVLADGLTYVSANPAPSSVVGQTLTWEYFDVPAGVPQVIQLTVEVTEPCANGEERVNNVEVEAIRSSECPTNIPAGFDEDSALVRCLPEPCVTLECSADPLEVCPGDDYTVTATATNCSDGAETITIYLDGEVCETALVPAGQTLTCERTLTAAVDCPAGSQVTHDFLAVATNECNPDPGVSDECSVTVTCLEEPCVSVVCDIDKTEVCPDEPYTVTATATNCSGSPETIDIYIDDVLCKSATVAAGQTLVCEKQFNAPSDCPSGSQITHNVRAVATNECNLDPGVSDECSVSTTCKPPPCVEAFCDVSNTEPGAGQPTMIIGSARNCGSDPVDIVITILGPDDFSQVLCESSVFTDVQPGETVSHECEWICPEQGSGVAYNFRVRANAENDCGSTSDQSEGECAVSCPEPGLCWMTTGGNHSGQDSKGQKLWTWGGNVGPPPHGSWQHTERDGEGNILFNFHSHDVEVFSCFHDGGDGPCHPGAEDNVILYGGTGEYNLGKGKKVYPAEWEARAEDHGEPGNTPDRDGGCGSPDFYYIKVWNADTDEVIFEHGEYVEGGNIQIHPLKENQMRRIDGAAGRTDLRSTDSGSLGLGDEGMQLGQLALYTPTPNPFNNTTRIAYAVKGGTSERVEIGIYNVAGKLVRKLVSGMESPGYHEAAWDARSDAGVQVSPGVYFLRAFVGDERIKGTRILYLK